MNDVLALVVPESSTVSLPGFRYSIHRFRMERSDRLNHLIVDHPIGQESITSADSRTNAAAWPFALTANSASVSQLVVCCCGTHRMLHVRGLAYTLSSQ